MSEHETPAAPAGKELSPSARKVQDALRARGYAHEVIETAAPARTSAEAARLVGCDVARIAKSLVFRTAQTGRAVLVIASGANRVNEWRIGVVLKEALEKAPAAFVRQVTGFAIGGIPPIGHATPIETFIDEDLMRHREIWTAGGTPNALFRLTPAELVEMTGGRVLRVT